MNKQQLFDLIDEKQGELFELLGSLIKINSVNFGSHGNEQEIAEYIHNICQELGLESDIYSPLDIEGFEKHPDYVPGRNLEKRYNVTACWKGIKDTNKLMLMGHSDTVEIGDLSKWSVDPYSGEIRDGRVWGRGACDDKYALATVLFVIKLLKENGFKPKENLLFTAYSDEEHGGSHGALAAILRYPCTHIVNMDGKENQIYNCATGGQAVKYIYHTKEPAESAKAAADVIPIVLEIIEKFADRRRAEIAANEFYDESLRAQTVFRYSSIHAGKLGDGEVQFSFYTDRTKDEIYRELSDTEKALEERLKPLGIISDGFKPCNRFFHYAFCEPDSEDIQNMAQAAKEVTGKQPVVYGSGFSDLSVILKYGSCNAFAFGMGRSFGEYGGMHQPDEYIECDKLIEYTKTIAAYIIKVLG